MWQLILEQLEGAYKLMAKDFIALSYTLAFIVGFLGLIGIITFFRRFLPHPEPFFHLGEEEISGEIDFIDFKVNYSQLAYYTARGLKVCSCRSYLGRLNKKMLDVSHSRILLAHQDRIPDFWKITFDNHKTYRFVFIGLSFFVNNNGEEMFYVQSLQWDDISKKWVRGALEYSERMRSFDLIVTVNDS